MNDLPSCSPATIRNDSICFSTGILQGMSASLTPWTRNSSEVPAGILPASDDSPVRPAALPSRTSSAPFKSSTLPAITSCSLLCRAEATCGDARDIRTSNSETVIAVRRARAAGEDRRQGREPVRVELAGDDHTPCGLPISLP